MSDIKQIRSSIELIPEKQAESELFIKLSEMIDHETDKFAAAIVDVASKYTDPNSVTKEVVSEVFRENGLPSVVGLLEEVSVVDHSTLLAFSAYILLYKGSRSGYETVLRLIGFEYDLKEWWEEGGTGKPNTISINVNLDVSVVQRPYETFQKIKKFTSEYVFPIIDPLIFTVTMEMGREGWTHAGFIHPTYNSILMTTDPDFFPPSLLGSEEILFPESLLFENTNFIVEADDLSTWNIKVNNDGLFKAFKQDGAQLTDKFAVQRRDGTLNEIRVTAEGVIYTQPSTSSGIAPNPGFYIVSRDGSKWTFDILNDNTIVSKRAVALVSTTCVPGRITLNWFNPYGSSTYDIYRSTDGVVYEKVADQVTSNTFSDSTITNGVKYYYKLKSPISTTEDIVKEAKAISRTLNSVVINDANSVTSLWDGATGAEGYRVVTLLAGNVVSTLELDGSARQGTPTGLLAGTQYTIRLLGYNNVGDGTTIVLGETIALTAPAAPASLDYDGTSSNTEIKMFWPTVQSATKYEIFKQQGDGTYTKYAETTLTTFDDTTISYGSINSYKVRAYNGNFSVFSEVLDVRQPGTFSILSTTNIDDNSFTVNYGNSLLANSYDFFYRKTGDPDSVITGVTTPKVLSGLLDYTSYTVRVEAVAVLNGIERRTLSSNVVVKTLIKPISALALVVNSDLLRIELSWPAATGAVQYKIYRSTDGTSFSLYQTQTGTSYNDTGLTSNVTYYYKVVSTDVEGRDSAGSNVVNGYYLKKVTDLSLVLDATVPKVTLSWTGIAGATSYEIYKSVIDSSSLTLYNTSATSSFVDTTPDSGKTNYYQVVAVNAGGQHTPKSNLVSTYFLNSVRDLSGVLDEVNDKVTLSWSAVTGATDYLVYQSIDGINYTTLETTSAITSTDLVLDSGKTNYYYVVARQGANVSLNSNIVSKYFIDNVETLSANLVGSETDLSWTAVPGATSYQVYRSTNSASGFTQIGTTSGTTFADTALTSGTQYWYRLVTVSAGGNSVPSASVTTATIYVAPVTLTGDFQEANDKIVLTWTASGGATSYDVQRSTDGTSYSVLTNVTGTTYSDTAMVSGATNYYRVVAKVGTSSSGTSNVVSTFYLNNPSNLTGSVDAVNGKVTLNWTGVTGADSYKVYRTTETTPTTWTAVATVTAPTTTYDDTSLVNNSHHWYRIVAMSGTNASLPSNQVDEFYAAPPTAATLTATVNTSDVTLTWSGAVNTVNYTVFRRVTAQDGVTTAGWQEYPTAGTTFTAGPVTDTSPWSDNLDGKKYEYYVRSNGTIATADSNQVSYTYQIPWVDRSASFPTTTLTFTSPSFDNNMFVATAQTATGTPQSIATSPDGLNWTLRNGPSNNGWIGRAAYGNSTWVLVSNAVSTVATSTDNGVTWVSRTSPGTNWNSVCFAAGKFVAVGTVSANGTGKCVMTSPDGITWTIQPSAIDAQWIHVMHDGTQYLAVASTTRTGETCKLMTSPDGITWTGNPSLPLTLIWFNLVYVNGRYTALASSRNGTDTTSPFIMTSTDLVNWVYPNIPGVANPASHFWNGAAYGNGVLIITAIAGAGTTGTKVAKSYDNGLNYVLDPNPDIAMFRTTFGLGRWVSMANSGTTKLLTKG
jgi:fibronectin type 3 domain-containing protein